MVISPTEEGSASSTDAQTGLSKDRRFSGAGSDTDIIVSSARAYVSALNKLLTWKLMRSMLKAKSNIDSGGIGNAQPVVVNNPVAVFSQSN